MEKITAGHPLSQSEDIVKQNIESLKALFPTIVKEGKIDIDELKALLGEDLETGEEYYRFMWAGKSQARQEANKPSTGTLIPNKADSKDWDTTQNIFIEGDNLEVLKLLQKSYANRIKMIYIDPPYNTGNDFIYKDNYKDNLGNYLSITGQADEEGKRLSTNADSDGRYHSNWLNMIYPRLKLSRNLLKDDGIIFISIDDNEAHNLKKVCDEIFGETNFIANIIWEKRFTRSNNAKLFTTLTEHILLYRKSDILESLKEPRNEKSDSIYSNPDNDSRGVWTSVSYVNPATKEQRPNLSYEIENPITKQKVVHPTNAWKYEYNTYLQHAKDNCLYWGQAGNNIYPRLKKFLFEMEGGMVPANLWTHEETGTTDKGSKILEELFGRKIFDFPKPPSLIKRMMKIGTQADNEDIILDFFSGSGTTADAIFQLNSEDRGNRKFICVQLKEPIGKDSEAFKAGFTDISQITKERIRRAGNKIANENKETLFNVNDFKLDLGFKAFGLDTSNINAWDGGTDNFEQNIFNSASNIKEGRTEEDVLYEILIKSGLDLSQPIVEKEIANKKVYNIGLGALFICLSDNISTGVAEGIGQWKTELNPSTCRVIFKDSGFTDVGKTNSIQTLKRYGITEVNSI
jgi:adenine-specific DNA-methyltransferase